MPIGMTWPKYLRLIGSSVFFMFLGSQFVHNIYKPLDNLDEFIDKYKDDYEKQTIGVGGQSKTIVKDNSKKT